LNRLHFTEIYLSQDPGTYKIKIRGYLIFGEYECFAQKDINKREEVGLFDLVN